MGWKLFNDDCLKVMPTLDSNSIDLIILDPPYNIGKDTWDKFPSHEEYLNFIYEVIKESERVLKDNGSLYLWHNDFNSLVDIYLKFKYTSFIFKQLIIWNKRFDGVYNKGFLDGFLVPDGLRNYQKMAEYCLYYTFQNKLDERMINNNINLFPIFVDKIRENIKESNLKKEDLIDLFIKEGRYSSIGSAKVRCSYYLCLTKGKYFEIITEDLFDYLNKFIHWDCSYDELKNIYLKEKDAILNKLSVFNNQKTHHSVWNYGIERTTDHITQKPIPLCENIIQHSTNPQDTILIPFAGSGSEMIASTNLKRNVIGIEKDRKYFKLINQRMKEFASQTKLG